MRPGEFDELRVMVVTVCDRRGVAGDVSGRYSVPIDAPFGHHLWEAKG